MAPPKKGNRITVDGETATIHIQHHGRIVEILIDAEDVERISKLTWSCGTAQNGYLFTQCSQWIKGVGQRTVRLPRFLMRAEAGAVIDHIDRNPLNNRKSNFRPVTPGQNAQNCGANKNNPSGVRGVTVRNGRYRARVVIDGKFHNLGGFATKEEADSVVSAFRANHMPFAVEARPLPTMPRIAK